MRKQKQNTKKQKLCIPFIEIKTIDHNIAQINRQIIKTRDSFLMG